MDIRKLSNELSVTSQIQPGDIKQIAELGFKAIICNRPDREEPGQTAFQDIAAEAAIHGLAVHYQPVRGNAITDSDADEFGAQLNADPKPVLAYCRSGTRCTILWSMSEAPRQPVEALVATAYKAGYDISGFIPRLVARASKASD